MAAVANKNIPLTGPDALLYALGKYDINAEEQRHRELIRSGPKSKRGKSVQALNVIEGLRRNKINPSQLMVRNVPVIPPSFRPFSIAGDQFIPGDANELYRDLFHYRDLYQQSRDLFGPTGARDAALDLYDTTKALYGYGDPIAPKTKQRGVSGFLRQITGVGPKWSFFQRKMVSKPLDSVARGTIAIDPNLSLDQIGIPKNMAWKMYAPHIQRRLVHSGMKPGDALLHIKDQTEMAQKALAREAAERPVIYSRAPSWHKFNVIAGKPQLIDGDTILVNPLICAGMNADFDGDNINLHVPAMPDSVKEAHEKLLPSKMLFSIKDYDQVMPKPTQEMILGLYTANRRQAKRSFKFGSQAEALAAIRKGDVDLSDDVQIG